MAEQSIFNITAASQVGVRTTHWLRITVHRTGRRTMRHLARVLHPHEHGLTPYRVVFRRAPSHPIRSMLDEGLWYRHPEREDTAIVWAQEEASITDVLTYHYQHSWSHLRVRAE